MDGDGMKCIDCNLPIYEAQGKTRDGQPQYWHNATYTQIQEAVRGTIISPHHPAKPYSQDTDPKTSLNRPR